MEKEKTKKVAKKKSKYTYRPQYGVIVICESENHQKIVFEHLKQFGYKLKIVVV